MNFSLSTYAISIPNIMKKCKYQQYCVCACVRACVCMVEHEICKDGKKEYLFFLFFFNFFFNVMVSITANEAQ